MMVRMKRDEVELAFARLKAAYIRQAQAKRLYRDVPPGSLGEAVEQAHALDEVFAALARAKDAVEDALDAYYETEGA